MRKFLKNVIYFILCLSILIFIILLYEFCKTFYSRGISTDIANWGQTGDFFGGVLNPIISFISVIILAYLTHRISEIEDDRAKKSISPVPSIIIDDENLIATIALKNFGLGPMEVVEINFIKDDQKTNNIFDHIPPISNLLDSYWWNPSYNSIISNGEAKIILQLKPFSNADSNNDWQQYRPRLRDSLRNVTVEVIYKLPLYNYSIAEPYTKRLNAFGTIFEIVEEVKTEKN